MTPDQALTKAAANLSHVANRDWQEFVAAFEAFTQSRILNVVSSPLDALQLNQGRAQNCAQLLKLLQDCNKAAGKP